MAARGHRRARARRWLGAAGAALTLALAASPPVQDLARVPAAIEVPAHSRWQAPWSRLIPVTVEPGPGVRTAAGDGRRLELAVGPPGRSYVLFKWFGRLLFRRVPVDVVPALAVVPGGESIGVIVRTQGLIVTGYDPLAGVRGLVDPAAEAGIEPGDVLVSVDGRPLEDPRQLVQATQAAGVAHRPVRVGDEGARRTFERWVWPVWDPARRRWELGLRVRDVASGVGTLTFWEPKSLVFRALGHSVSDGLTRRPVAVRDGQLLGARIVNIVPGTVDSPGEKVGVLTPPPPVGGRVTGNDRFGLSGVLSRAPDVGPSRPVPLALPDQVHPGPATLVTVVRGLKPEWFAVQILATYPQTHPAVKGILFRVTDPRLLRLTGGVVQGMSGSPLLQDGRLVGAVTHVLVNRPQLGYACYAAWMLPPAGARQDSGQG
ncbi:MAG: SpoIVB peptidase [Actinomycetia bacterium]|nr:SpoIVB peptidase [Actinomycetes bacterium]